MFIEAMGEISPGFEMNKIVKGDLLTRWMLFCSLGVRYTFLKKIAKIVKTLPFL
jgi:hypothetical protein